jgi:hypothetical protein
MSAARLIVTTGVAWVLSLALALAVVMGVHRALAQNPAEIGARQEKAKGLIAASLTAGPPRAGRVLDGPRRRIDAEAQPGRSTSGEVCRAWPLELAPRPGQFLR